ncbi:MAG: hypothetical protein CMJ85_09960 [Planctomycetes bacterium]|nr:hypothetical protein [Planctomycetota bacterium]
MRAAVVAVGDELLDGRVTDTNSSMLAGKLSQLGVEVVLAQVIGDSLDAVVRGIRDAVELADVVLVTGGIGPTADDRTREALAVLTGRVLVEDAASWAAIRAIFDSRGLEVPESNRQQALCPEGATVLVNHTGTAPGFCVDIDDVRVFVMPGVPSEARRMFDDEVAPQLDVGSTSHTETLCFGGVSESLLGGMLQRYLSEGGAVRVGITSSWGLLRVTARADTKRALDDVISEIRSAGKRWFVGTGYRELEDLVAERAIASATTLAVAESLTAGLATARLGRVAGISSVLLEGVVTYSNASKTSRLGVSEQTLSEHGAVSEQCAREMAEGLARTSDAGLAASATGIAGPSGGSDAKPVGLVWLATTLDGTTETRERRYGPVGRDIIRNRAASDLLLMMLQRLLP